MGFFDGVWLSADKRARFFVRTVAGAKSRWRGFYALEINSWYGAEGAAGH
jgi:hypothetical protein